MNPHNTCYVHVVQFSENRAFANQYGLHQASDLSQNTNS